MVLGVSDEELAMKIGAELESTCRNCGVQVHTVVALPNASTASVACKTCGAAQNYLAAEGSVIAPMISVNSSGKVRPTPRRPKKPAPVWRPDQSAVRAVLSRPVRPYDVGGSYRVGDRIEHRTYGVGVVDAIVDPHKMQVFFPSGHRTMTQHRPVAD